MRRTLLPALLLAALLPFPAQARVVVEATSNSNLGPLLAVKISEEIAPGDYEALMQGIRANPGKHGRRIALLDSIGGSVAEAIRMGRLLRETGFEVIVPSSGVCQGSCIYLLAAGKRRIIRGAVALHRPYYPGGDSWQSELNRQSANPRSYLREMNVKPDLVDAMHQVAPGRLRLLSEQELARYGLH